MKQENLIELKNKSEHLEELKGMLTKRQNEFETENKALIESIDQYENSCSEVKDWIRNEATQEFKDTGEKKLLGGVGIRVSTKLDYIEDEAMSWAKLHMSVAVKEILDKKQFEAFAKTNDLDFVKKEEQVSVTFPKEIKL